MENLLGFYQGNRGDAIFWVGLQKYIIFAAFGCILKIDPLHGIECIAVNVNIFFLETFLEHFWKPLSELGKLGICFLG